MRRWVRAAGLAAAAAALAGATTLSASVLAQPAPTAAPTSQAPGGRSELAGLAGLAAGVPALQERLRRLPGDWNAWAELGAAYVAEARRTADPSYYARAEQAYARSTELRPEDNAAALAGQGALAASRHDFHRALELGRRAQQVNPYSATAQGVLVDALVELGRYGDAAIEMQRMVDLRPDVASFTRVAYYRELTGDLDGARVALEQAARFAFAAEDRATIEQYLGDLAFSQGSLDEARSHYEAGLRHVPGAPRLLAGRALAEAARGATDVALADYADVVQRLPEPGYLAQYGELLDAAGRTEEAEQQYALVDTMAELFRIEGADPDPELALHHADRGRAQTALELAQRQYAARRSVHVEDAYAWALHTAGRHREALEHARAAERLSDRNALFAYHRGMIERALGLHAEAEQSLRRALQANPHFSPVHAPRAQRALTALEAGA